MCRTFAIRLDESVRKQEEEDLKLREIVAKAGDRLKTLQSQRETLRHTSEQNLEGQLKKEEDFRALHNQMEAEINSQVSSDSGELSNLNQCLL